MKLGVGVERWPTEEPVTLQILDVFTCTVNIKWILMKGNLRDDFCSCVGFHVDLFIEERAIGFPFYLLFFFFFLLPHPSQQHMRRFQIVQTCNRRTEES